MISIGIMLFVWGVLFFTMSVVVFWYACKFMKAAKKNKAMIDEMVKTAEIRLQRQYNRIATMPTSEFHEFLATAFSKAIEVVSYRDISKNDPDGSVSLYTLAVEEMLKYIGQETIEAVDYYYGKNYIPRWCFISYKLLEKRGVVTSVIDQKTIRSDTIMKMM